MSTWRVEQHYGFGAAQIPIRPEPHRAAQLGFAEGVGILIRDLTEGGPVAMLRRTAGDPAVPWRWRALNEIEVETAALDRFGLDPLLQARAELRRIRGRLFFRAVKALKSKIRGDR